MRYFGVVGYGFTSETTPGVYVDTIVEHEYFGDVVKVVRRLDDAEGLNKDISVQNAISIVADGFATENLLALRYVEWSGIRWTVSNVEVEPPRLTLRLGVLYNGPTP